MRKAVASDGSEKDQVKMSTTNTAAPTAETPRRRRFTTSTYIKLLAVYTVILCAFVTTVAVVAMGPRFRAVVLMGTTLLVVWCGIGGWLQYRYRDRVRAFVLRIPLDYRVKFVLFATLMALLEEVVTVSITNLAPLYGVKVGQAYITASANYLDVVCLHSVVVFIPGYVVWSLYLSRYYFSPNAMFLLYGLSGVIAETMFSGPSQLPMYGFWTFVYGLMIYLPTYTLPSDRDARRPRPINYISAMFFTGISAGPVAGLVSLFHNVRMHFPPIPPNS